MDYYSKYLKYKNKYLALQMSGGSKLNPYAKPFIPKIEQPTAEIKQPTAEIKQPTAEIEQPTPEVTELSECRSKFNSDDKKVSEAKEYIRSIVIETLIKNKDNSIEYMKFLTKFIAFLSHLDKEKYETEIGSYRGTIMSLKYRLINEGPEVTELTENLNKIKNEAIQNKRLMNELNPLKNKIEKEIDEKLIKSEETQIWKNIKAKVSKEDDEAVKQCKDTFEETTKNKTGGGQNLI